MRKLIPIFLLLLVAVAWAGPQGDLQNGNEAYRQKNYVEAAKWYWKASRQGLAEAQFNLGLMFEQGQGVPKNLSKAVTWYRKAAEQGLADAQFSLASRYYLGEGVPQDYKAAVTWYRKAAEQGLADAQHNLGAMYQQGQGVPKDLREAVKWYRMAAEQGDAKAQQYLQELEGASTLQECAAIGSSYNTAWLNKAFAMACVDRMSASAKRYQEAYKAVEDAAVNGSFTVAPKHDQNSCSLNFLFNPSKHVPKSRQAEYQQFHRDYPYLFDLAFNCRVNAARLKSCADRATRNDQRLGQLKDCLESENAVLPNQTFAMSNERLLAISKASGSERAVALAKARARQVKLHSGDKFLKTAASDKDFAMGWMMKAGEELTVAKSIAYQTNQQACATEYAEADRYYKEGGRQYQFRDYGTAMSLFKETIRIVHETDCGY